MRPLPRHGAGRTLPMPMAGAPAPGALRAGGAVQYLRSQCSQCCPHSQYHPLQYHSQSWCHLRTQCHPQSQCHPPTLCHAHLRCHPHSQHPTPTLVPPTYPSTTHSVLSTCPQCHPRPQCHLPPAGEGGGSGASGAVPHVPLPRFLVHRYSVLRQHAEANGVEGLDALDPPPTATKGGYHDDSDEVNIGGVPLSPPLQWVRWQGAQMGEGSCLPPGPPGVATPTLGTPQGRRSADSDTPLPLLGVALPRGGGVVNLTSL